MNIRSGLGEDQLKTNKTKDNDQDSVFDENMSNQQVSNNFRNDENSNTENIISNSEEERSESKQFNILKYFYIS